MLKVVHFISVCNASVNKFVYDSSEKILVAALFEESNGGLLDREVAAKKFEKATKGLKYRKFSSFSKV